MEFVTTEEAKTAKVMDGQNQLQSVSFLPYLKHSHRIKWMTILKISVFPLTTEETKMTFLGSILLFNR